MSKLILYSIFSEEINHYIWNKGRTGSTIADSFNDFDDICKKNIL